MGLSLADFQSGAASVGSILDKATNAWATITGKTTTQQTTQSSQSAAPAAPSASAVTQSSTPTGLAAVPTWAWLAGGVAMLWVLSGRR
jgi:hypothetical protein